MTTLKILTLIALVAVSAEAFVTSGKFFHRPSATTKPLQLFEDATDFCASANNFLLSTIDSDIAKIPDNEFGKVFAGGLVVMAGGVLSALIVGFLLERGNLYANVAAESYLQSSDDEEFWKGLSEEEAKKTKALLQKIKESKEGRTSTPDEPEPIKAAEPVLESSTTSSPPKTPEETENSKPKDMFSDY